MEWCGGNGQFADTESNWINIGHSNRSDGAKLIGICVPIQDQEALRIATKSDTTKLNCCC